MVSDVRLSDFITIPSYHTVAHPEVFLDYLCAKLLPLPKKMLKISSLLALELLTSLPGVASD